MMFRLMNPVRYQTVWKHAIMKQQQQQQQLQQQLQQQYKRRAFSSNPLAGDAGALATRMHAMMATSLAILAPVYMLLPEESTVSRGTGVLLAANMASHSWVGLNYVATDYVPKLTKKLLGPSRFVAAGMGAMIFIGLTRMSLSSPGGIKGALRGLWNPPSSKEEDTK